ncbi:MAG TPA: hypothetical protein VFQ35_22825, partial [Polyangiaceae bacterium]|nr:hypothetical protein [Polyangiaceae bacterium]
WAEKTSSEPRPEFAAFTPDLRPFQSLLQSLARTDAYRVSGYWKANVTLKEHDDGSYSYWSREPSAAAVRRQLKPSRGIAMLIGELQGVTPRKFDELVAHVLEQLELDESTAIAALIHLAKAGVLVGGLQLPSRFDSAWDALAKAAEHLRPEHRRAWWRAYLALRRICRQLENVSALTPSTLEVAFTRAQAAIEALATALGLECPTFPRVPLRADLRLGFAFTLGRDFRERIERDLAEYSRFQSAYGLGQCLRRAAWHEELTRSATPVELNCIPPAEEVTSPPEGPLTWDAYASLFSAGSQFRQRIRKWEALLTSGAATVTCEGEEEQPSPPFACFLFGGAPGAISIHGIAEELAPVYARYGLLWTQRSKRPRDELFAWYHNRLAAVQAEARIRIVELVTPCEQNPNALARPAFTPETLSVWCADPSELPLAGSQFFVDPLSHAVFLQAPTFKKPLAVFSFASANVGWSDPVCQRLLTTSFRVARLAHLRADSVPFRAELELGKASPEVRIGTGAIVRARRSIITGTALVRWLALDAPARFAEWLRLAEENDWGSFVLVRRDDGHALLVPVQSPLALEAVLEGAAAAHMITIERFSEEAWIRDAEGKRYIAEFAVPFVRARNAWNAEVAAHAELATSEHSFAAPAR